MADTVYGLSKADVEILRKIVRDYRSGHLGRPMQPQPEPLGERDTCIFGVADAAIKCTSGTLTEAKSGTLNVYRISSTGGTSDAGYDETVWNLSSVGLSTADYTTCVRDHYSGKWIAISPRKKQLCSFVLDAALATSDPSASALLTAQWGEGAAHSTGSITVYNMDKSGGTYVFSGSSGNAGLAMYNSATNWRIIQMECT